MENMIINHKQISLEKNKEFIFKIPILITPLECTFQIEVSEHELSQDCNIQLKLKSTKSDSKNEQFSIQLNDKIINGSFEETNLRGEYLLLACISDRKTSFAISIAKKTIRSF